MASRGADRKGASPKAGGTQSVNIPFMAGRGRGEQTMRPLAWFGAIAVVTASILGIAYVARRFSSPSPILNCRTSPPTMR
jgi:hypothetical protein